MLLLITNQFNCPSLLQNEAWRGLEKVSCSWLNSAVRHKQNPAIIQYSSFIRYVYDPIKSSDVASFPQNALLTKDISYPFETCLHFHLLLIRYLSYRTVINTFLVWYSCFWPQFRRWEVKVNGHELFHSTKPRYGLKVKYAEDDFELLKAQRSCNSYNITKSWNGTWDSRSVSCFFF